MNIIHTYSYKLRKIFNNKIHSGASFDDYLIRPGFAELTPNETSIEAALWNNYGTDLSLQLPIFSAAMDTISESAMGVAMSESGGIAVIHKNLTPEKQAAEVKIVKDAGGIVAAAVGVKASEMERAEKLIVAGADVLVIDSSHGHSKNVGNMVKELRRAYPGLFLVAGNVATGEGALYLEDCGASAVKVGIGPGSICTTRVVSGCGVPQLYAIYDVSLALNKRVPIIADGGIKESGDMVKALAVGADAVMIGNMLSGTDETPGEVKIDANKRPYKEYRGMGSIAAMKRGSKDRYFQDNVNDDKKFVPEGIESVVPCKGSAKDLLYKMGGGLRVGLGLSGSENISELKKRKIYKITKASVVESRPHSVQEKVQQEQNQHSH
ncbi:MAG: IMP dehydrogenase [Rickettsiales bacterium]|jgi:IMP dehydrogenase|nr:IMP dehydrogenase [Rickettsiales bacterium]